MVLVIATHVMSSVDVTFFAVMSVRAGANKIIDALSIGVNPIGDMIFFVTLHQHPIVSMLFIRSMAMPHEHREPVAHTVQQGVAVMARSGLAVVAALPIRVNSVQGTPTKPNDGLANISYFAAAEGLPSRNSPGGVRDRGRNARVMSIIGLR